MHTLPDDIRGDSGMSIETELTQPEIGPEPQPPSPSDLAETRVRHFRQILLWPIYLMAADGQTDIPDYGEYLLANDPERIWREVDDEFTGDPADFQERHYNEFVAFLPAVQRFIYGQGVRDPGVIGVGDSPIRVLRRTDVGRVRVQLAPEDRPLVFDVAHVDLCFFYDIDLAMLAVELYADDLPLRTAQDAMFRLGRAYPAYWEENGQAGHCPWRTEWLSADGRVLAASDYENRAKYLAFTCRHRSPCVAAHWEFLLRPLVPHHAAEDAGPIRYRQLEYYRMPLMAYLALENSGKLRRSDIVRLATASGPEEGDKPGFGKKRRADFATQYSTTRVGELDYSQSSGSLYLSSGRAMVVVGDAKNEFFTHFEHGTLARFRHQNFLLFLIAHFHRAALLMFSDRLAEAVGRLDIRNSEAVRSFRHDSREALETFLRFTHRYWFYEISDQAETAELFELCRRHLGLDRLFADIRQEAQDMNRYLEGEALRRQNETVVRLTVVTILGLVGTVVTGFLGMNLFAFSEETLATKILLFVAVTIPTVLLTFHTVRRSRRLSEFLEALSDEESPFRAKWHAFVRIWWAPRLKDRIRR
jgi:hypothetical protein